jgi:UDP-sugar pyrophosphorylase
LFYRWFRTLNVAYNQLDPLLQDSGFPEGDVDDETTGFCPFPGNINQLIFRADKYVEVLDKTRYYTNGSMPEFVNPKYKDHAKMELKYPTRVECAMQDFDTFLYKFQEEADTKRVGFTSVDAGLCFSPLKNSTADGALLQKNGIPPATAGSAEADQYAIHRKLLRSVGVRIVDDPVETFGGVSFVGGPHVVISPELLLCSGDYKAMFPYPKQVQIAKGSSLVIKGKGQLVIESLRLEGALVVDCEEGSKSTISDVFIKNNGWKRVAVEDDCEDEVMILRGYKLEKFETCDIVRKERDDCVIL